MQITQTQIEVNNLIAELQPIAKEIGVKASKGDRLSQQIINYYRMLERCYDGMTFVLLEESLKEYKNEPNQKPD